MLNINFLGLLSNMNKPYLVYTSEYSLQGADLYSGGENDPLTDAHIHAMEHLAYDSRGKKLPFSLQVSFPCQPRDNYLLEEKSVPLIRFDQKVWITVLIWRNLEDYFAYEQSDKIYTL